VSAAAVLQQQAGGVSTAPSNKLTRPDVALVPGNVAGSLSRPRGIILHATRSGVAHYDATEEYDATVRYVRNGAGGLGWNVTVGPGRLAIHMSPRQWGWNARGASSQYLAIEFAQSQLGRAILDSQIEAAAWWIAAHVLPAWGTNVVQSLPEHRELAEGIADGKSDVGADQRVASRLLARLREAGAL
jgi:hypothetical protein